MKHNYPLIDSCEFSEYTPSDYAQKLKAIIAFTQRVNRDNKLKAKVKRDTFKVGPKQWSFRVQNGKGVIIIRKRKPIYLFDTELADMYASHAEHVVLIDECIQRRNIAIRSAKK